MEDRQPITIGVVTLGCDKNTVDAEYIAGLLTQKGIHVVEAERAPADVDGVVILTCGFIDPAQQESVDTIVNWLDRKEDRDSALVVAVAGCLTQNRAHEMAEELPDIDLISGVGDFGSLCEQVANLARARRAMLAGGDEIGRTLPIILDDEIEKGDGDGEGESREPNATVTEATPRVALEASATAYLKIADGCNYTCAFCSIPQMKGPYHSVAPDILIDEMKQLVARGAREVVLVAQDVSAYGMDLDGPDRWNLSRLLRELCAVEGDFWLRILYCYPGGLTEELIAVMAGEPKICPYLDIPLQHLDPGLVKAMRRPNAELKVFDRIDALRRAIPDVALRTTFIVGFPGEGQREFMRLLNGLRQIKFDNVGFFPFSPQDGTTAAEMGEQVKEHTKEARIKRLARRQAQVAEELAQRFVGRDLETLVDGRFPDSDLFIGHTKYQAPEVDGMIRFTSSKDWAPGERVLVHVDAVDGYDLVGHVLPE